MSDRNRRLVLAERPSGNIDEKTVRLEETDVPEPGPGEALLRNRYLSIDPTIRTWMDDRQGYLPPIAIDEVVRSAGVAEVVRSNSDSYGVGELVFGFTGWQDYAIADEGESPVQKLPEGIDPLAALSVFGTTGMTAYFGLIDVGKISDGDNVGISGAAGATGSTVGQIAREPSTCSTSSSEFQRRRRRSPAGSVTAGSPMRRTSSKASKTRPMRSTCCSPEATPAR